MKIIPMKEKNPEKEGLYFTINYKGYVSLCLWEKNSWYYMRHNEKEKITNDDGISWIYKE